MQESLWTSSLEKITTACWSCIVIIILLLCTLTVGVERLSILGGEMPCIFVWSTLV